jgi:hypothetical protein
MVSHNESYIYGYPFDSCEDVAWVSEQITRQVQAVGGTVKGSQETLFVALPAGMKPEQISPLGLLRWNVMVF